LVGDEKSQGQKEGDPVETDPSKGMFTGLRTYLHDLIHLRSLRREMDQVEMWREQTNRETSQPQDDSKVDLGPLLEIIQREESSPLQHPIYLSGLKPSTGSEVDPVKAASQQLIKAERLFFRSLKKYEVAFAQNSYPLAEVLFRFAKIFSNRAEYDRATSYLLKGWAIVEKVGRQKEPLASRILIDLVESSHRSKNYYESDKGFYTLLDLTEEGEGEQSPEMGEILNGLANYFVSCGEYNKATLIFDRALNIFLANGMENHTIFINILNSSGSMYYGLQVFSEAHRLYNLAVVTIEKYHLYSDTNSPILFHNAGLVCCHINRMQEARGLLVKSLVMALQNGQEWVLWKGCYSLSYLFSKEENLPGALFFGKLAVAITLQSWQVSPDQPSEPMDQFLTEHMEKLFEMAQREQEWDLIQEVIAHHTQTQSEIGLEDSWTFFSGEEKTQFQVFLMLSLQVKQVPINLLVNKKHPSQPESGLANSRLKELESGFLKLLARWEIKKVKRPSRLSPLIT
jgi:tetratricopeptide (TPR) repeat protein